MKVVGRVCAGGRMGGDNDAVKLRARQELGD